MNFHPHIHAIVLGGGLDVKNHWTDTLSLHDALPIYSYDTLTEHMWFWFYKMLFCRQRNNLTTTGKTLAYIFIMKEDG